MSPGPSQAAVEQPETEHPSISNPVLAAPEFPDFENPEVETPEGEALDIAALEAEALDLVSFDLPTPPDFELEFEDPHPDLSGCEFAQPTSSELHDVNLGNHNLIPLNPDNFPDPPKLSELREPWFQSEDGIGAHLPNPPAGEADLEPSEPNSLTEEGDLGNHAALNNGIQTHPRWDAYFHTVCSLL